MGSFPLKDFEEIGTRLDDAGCAPRRVPPAVPAGPPLLQVVPESKRVLPARQASNADGLLGQGSAT